MAGWEAAEAEGRQAEQDAWVWMLSRVSSTTSRRGPDLTVGARGASRSASLRASSIDQCLLCNRAGRRVASACSTAAVRRIVAAAIVGGRAGALWIARQSAFELLALSGWRQAPSQ